MRGLVRQMSPRRRSAWLVRLFFLLAFPLLVVQMLAARWWSEPFPAIMMPRFTDQTVHNGVTTWKDVRITLEHDDGTRSIIDKNRLLDPMHLPQRNKVLRRVFGPDGLARRDESVRVWLSDRVASLTRRDDARRLHFTWFEVEARFAEPGQAKWERVLGRLTVDLKRSLPARIPGDLGQVSGGPPRGEGVRP